MRSRCSTDRQIRLRAPVYKAAPWTTRARLALWEGATRTPVDHSAGVYSLREESGTAGASTDAGSIDQASPGCMEALSVDARLVQRADGTKAEGRWLTVPMARKAVGRMASSKPVKLTAALPMVFHELHHDRMNIATRAAVTVIAGVIGSRPCLFRLLPVGFIGCLGGSLQRLQDGGAGFYRLFPCGIVGIRHPCKVVTRPEPLLPVG